MLYYASHLIDYSMFLTGKDRVAWVTGHIHGRGKLEDEFGHPSPEYLLARYAFNDGTEGILECGPLAPDLPPGGNEFWMDAGVTVLGTRGYVQVVAASGLWAQTCDERELIRVDAHFDVTKDQPPYIRELADWLDDDSRPHCCNGDHAFHSFEVFMGACLSSLDRRPVLLPLTADDDILARMRKELPDVKEEVKP